MYPIIIKPSIYSKVFTMIFLGLFGYLSFQHINFRDVLNYPIQETVLMFFGYCIFCVIVIIKIILFEEAIAIYGDRIVYKKQEILIKDIKEVYFTNYKQAILKESFVGKIWTSDSKKYLYLILGDDVGQGIYDDEKIYPENEENLKRAVRLPLISNQLLDVLKSTYGFDVKHAFTKKDALTLKVAEILSTSKNQMNP